MLAIIQVKKTICKTSIAVVYFVALSLMTVEQTLREAAGRDIKRA